MDTRNASPSAQDFLRSFDKLKLPLSLPETEESWDQIYKALERLEKLCRENASEHPIEVVSSLRSVHRNIVSAMNSERTRLSGAALDLVSLVASCLGGDFEPLLSLFFPRLLTLSARTNKVVVSRAKACILAIVEATQLPGILTYFIQFSKDKSPTARLVVAEGTLACLKCFNPPDLEKESQSSAIETLIRNSVRDANADIRKVGKDIFQNYKLLLPARVESFAAPLTPTIRKYLQLSSVNSRPTSAMSSRPKAPPKAISQSSNAPAERTVGPIRHHKSTIITSKPSAPSAAPSRPLRTIQAPTRRGEGADSLSAPTQPKSSATMTRPFTQDKNAAGPQRIIRPNTTSADGPSVAATDRREIKPAPAKTTVSLRSRTASTGVQPTSSLPGSSKQVPVARKVSAPTKTPAEASNSTASRDLTRPTQSQLARIRPPVTRPPVSRPIRALEVRKIKPSAGPAATAAAGRTLSSSKSQAPGAPRKPSRPATPCTIPLPPSPKQESFGTSDLPGVPSNVSASIDEPKDQPLVEHTLAQGDEAPTSDIPRTENSVSTPLAGELRVPGVNLALKTPISALLSSIQHGFDLTPCSPLSPPQDYLVAPNLPLEGGPFRLGVIRQDAPSDIQT